MSKGYDQRMEREAQKTADAMIAVIKVLQPLNTQQRQRVVAGSRAFLGMEEQGE